MNVGSAKLHHAIKALKTRWEETRVKWDDKTSQDFEDDHLTPLERQANSAIRGIDELADVLRKVRQDCA